MTVCLDPHRSREAATLFVTTSVSRQHNLYEEVDSAKREAEKTGWEYVERERLSRIIQQLALADVLVFSGSGVYLRRYAGGRLTDRARFHPSASLLRLRNIRSGGDDVLVKALGIGPGDSVLDCTMGLGSDSIIAAFAVRPGGCVTSLEASLPIFEAMDLGMRGYRGDDSVEQAITLIDRRMADYREFLSLCEEGSYDVVYMDPMFTKPTSRATPVDAIRPWAIRGLPGASEIRAACRASRRRVVIKVRKGEDLSAYGSLEGFKVFHSSRAGSVEYVGWQKGDSIG